MPINIKYVKNIFEQMTSNKAFLDKHDFIAFMRKNPDALAWFTKPDLALKQRIKEFKSEQQNDLRELLMHLEEISEETTEYYRYSMDEIR